MYEGLILEKSKIPEMGSLVINYSIDDTVEKEGYRGMCHLAEHLICHSYDNLMDALLCAGINSNAYTYRERVTFFWMGLDEKIEEFQAELLKLLEYYPTEEQFDNEKRIVLQEYDDSAAQQQFLFENISRKYYNYHGSIGIREDIEDISYDDIMVFLKDTFDKPTSIIRVGESKTIEELCEGFEYSEPRDEFEIECKNYNTPYEVGSFSNKSTLVADWLNLDMAKYAPNDISFINLMLSQGLSSPLYQEIREKLGLVYWLATYQSPMGSNNIMWIFYYGCDIDNLQKIRDVFLDCLSRSNELLDEDRYNVIVEYYHNTAKINHIFNYKIDSMTKYFEYGRKDRIINLEYIEQLTFEHIKSVISDLIVDIKNGIRPASLGEELII